MQDRKIGTVENAKVYTGAKISAQNAGMENSRVEMPGVTRCGHERILKVK